MSEIFNHPIIESEKREICSWQYPGEYAIYSLPPYEEMLQRQMGFCNPDKERNFRVWYDGSRLVGFTNLLEEEQEVFVGIGVHPKCCNQGYGRLILEEACKLSKEFFPGKPLYLEVRSWNQRAVRCYQRAGFRIDGDAFTQRTSIGVGTFFRMVRR